MSALGQNRTCAANASKKTALNKIFRNERNEKHCRYRGCDSKHHVASGHHAGACFLKAPARSMGRDLPGPFER